MRELKQKQVEERRQTRCLAHELGSALASGQRASLRCHANDSLNAIVLKQRGNARQPARKTNIGLPVFFSTEILRIFITDNLRDDIVLTSHSPI